MAEQRVVYEPHGEQLCGVCGQHADVMATVPMCGERPRYPMCLDCWLPVEEAGYCEDVVMLAASIGDEPQ